MSPVRGKSVVSFVDSHLQNKSFLKPPAATDHYGLNGTKLSESTPVSPALSSASQSLSAATLSGSSPYDVNRTLDATKKPRNIFGTLRNKLSLSKKSKSLDNSQYSPTHVGQIHSASSTLSRGSTMDQRKITCFFYIPSMLIRNLDDRRESPQYVIFYETFLYSTSDLPIPCFHRIHLQESLAEVFHFRIVGRVGNLQRQWANVRP